MVKIFILRALIRMHSKWVIKINLDIRETERMDTVIYTARFIKEYPDKRHRNYVCVPCYDSTAQM